MYVSFFILFVAFSPETVCLLALWICLLLSQFFDIPFYSPLLFSVLAVLLAVFVLRSIGCLLLFPLFSVSFPLIYGRFAYSPSLFRLFLLAFCLFSVSFTLFAWCSVVFSVSFHLLLRRCSLALGYLYRSFGCFAYHAVHGHLFCEGLFYRLSF